MTDMKHLPPDWYDDGSGTRQWWDGTAWTNAYQPRKAYWTMGRVLLTLFLAFVVTPLVAVFLIVAAIAGNH
jgi:hypothetical protein